MAILNFDVWDDTNSPFKEEIKEMFEYTIVLGDNKDKLIDIGYLFKNILEYISSIPKIKIPAACLNNNCIITCGNVRFSMTDNPQLEKIDFRIYKEAQSQDSSSFIETIVDNKHLFIEHKYITTDNRNIASECVNFEENIDVFYKEAVEDINIYEEDEAPEEIIRIYRERHHSNEDEVLLKARLLGIYCSEGYGNHVGEPCVVLFPRNILICASDLNEEYKLNFSNDDAFNYLKQFVLDHELAHAFFDKEKNEHLQNCDIRIEECLANYSALLKAKENNDNNILYIGKALVENQSNLKFNLGYNYALQLFDDNFEPKLKGWWKWRYCNDLAKDVTYKELSKTTDLIDILEIKQLKFK